MKLRDYQIDCEDAIRTAHESVDSTLVVLPTGCGKTEVFVSYGGKFGRDGGGADEGRVLTICPTIELVDQGAAKFTARTGIAPAIEQAHRTSDETSFLRSPFVCASKQTLVAKRGGEPRYKRLRDIALVIIDEAHYAATKQWGELIGHFRDSGAKVLGVTATPNRADNVALGNLFESSAYEMWIPDAIDRGWLVSPRAACCQLESLDLSQVRTNGSRGDFREKDLQKVMEQEKVVFETAEVTARESVVEGRTLKTVVYCSSVAEARGVAERLRDHHRIAADWVCGDKRLCPPDRRKEVLADFAWEAGKTTHVCNVGVLTTGWDFPGLEHIVMGRPTRSLSLYTQILGRGTRPLPGVVDFEGSEPSSRRQAIAESAKPHFKVTDLCDNTLEHRLAGVADVLAGLSTLATPKNKRSIEEVAAEKVAKQARRGETIDVAEALEKAKEAEAKRREKAEERRRKRKEIASQAKYERVEVDSLGQGGKGSVRKRGGGIRYSMPFGKHKGEPLGDLPTKYLNALLWAHEDASKPFRLFRQLEFMVKSELSSRRSERVAERAAKPKKPATKAATANQTTTFEEQAAALQRQLAELVG